MKSLKDSSRRGSGGEGSSSSSLPARDGSQWTSLTHNVSRYTGRPSKAHFRKTFPSVLPHVSHLHTSHGFTTLLHSPARTLLRDARRAERAVEGLHTLVLQQALARHHAGQSLPPLSRELASCPVQRLAC